MELALYREIKFTFLKIELNSQKYLVKIRIRGCDKMGYTALYRKFRPMTFSEMVGQEAITRTLKNQIQAARVGHAYLFNGGRGTGKTTAAKIMARAINCLNPKEGEPCNECEICKGAINGSLTDIVEMDAASNNSVEDIRSIREEVNFLPTKAKYRVYIIDEVHMLSPGAFNALLKTLEEPPEHVKFILATTEPQKLPATILSRCQRFDFKRIPNESIIKRLEIVCKESQIQTTEGALRIISVLAEGGMRDALSILERCIQDGENKLDEDKIRDLIGIPKMALIHRIIQAILTYDVEKAIEVSNEVIDQGKDLETFLWEMIKYAKDILVYQACQTLGIYGAEEIEEIKKLATQITKERLVKLVYDLSELENAMKWSSQKNIIFQAGMIRFCHQEIADTNESLGERVQKIEEYLKSGAYTSVSPRQTEKMGSPSSIINTPSIPQSQDPKITSEAIKTNPIEIENKAKPKTGTIEQKWPTILNQLKQNGKIVLYTNLMNTKATKMNDMTVSIQFPRGLTSFGKTVLEKPENKKEIANLIYLECGKEMQIKYVDSSTPTMAKPNLEQDLQNLAKQSDIPFQVIE